MRSRRGLFASIAFLLALPLAALCQMGIVAMATVACVKAYSLGLAYQGTSLDARAPLLKTLWLMPFVWILLESTTGKTCGRQ